MRLTLFSILVALPLCVAANTGVVDNCGISVPLQPATRIVALNQQATEALIAIGADNQLLGGAYRDDQPAARWRQRFEQIPNLAKEYPNPELLLAMKPQLLVAGFNSAFSDWGVGPRERWQQKQVNSYLFSSGCKGSNVTLDGLFTDMTRLGELTGHQLEAQKWIAQQQQRVNAVSQQQPASKPKVLLWLREYDIPYVAGCCGAGNLIIEQAGGINVAADLPKQWGHLSWEAVLARQPDLILMVDSNWSSFAQKQQHLTKSPLLRLLSAVNQKSYAPIAFSETVAGVRLVDGIELANRHINEWHSQ